MKFAPPRPGRTQQDRAIVPMINVVFLLLIFFLMTASLTPSAPFDIDLALAEGTPADQDPEALYIAADGQLGFGAARGEAVFAALAAREADTPLGVWADAALPAAELAALLPRLAASGVADVRLRTLQP